MCIVMYTHDILKTFSVMKLHINLYIYIFMLNMCRWFRSATKVLCQRSY